MSSGRQEESRKRAIVLLAALFERHDELDATEHATELVDALTNHILDVALALEHARTLPGPECG